MSNGALCATSTLPRANSRNDAITAPIGGAVDDHRVGDAGEHADERADLLAGIDEGLELAEHLAAADLHRADLGDARRCRPTPPVVSRSTTVNVVVRSG